MSNALRVANRAACVERVRALTVKHPSAYWIDGLSKRAVPCGPVNTIDQVFANPQVKAREMVVEIPHAATGKPERYRGDRGPARQRGLLAAPTRPRPSDPCRPSLQFGRIDTISSISSCRSARHSLGGNLKGHILGQPMAGERKASAWQNRQN